MGLKIVHYAGKKLITLVVNEILATGLIGTTCALTTTNEQAMTLTGLLVKSGLKAKLAQTNDGFNLNDLFEIRFFLKAVKSEEHLTIIHDELWNKIKKSLSVRFSNAVALEVCMNFLTKFEEINPSKKYVSDLESFIFESKLEDFYTKMEKLFSFLQFTKPKEKSLTMSFYY